MGSVMYILQKASARHEYLRVMTLGPFQERARQTMHIPRTGSEMRSLDFWAPVRRSTGGHVLSMILPTDIHVEALLD